MAKKNNTNERQFSVENELKTSAALSQEELFQKYNTSLEGLSVVDIEDIDEKYGKNTIEFGNNYSIWNRLREHLLIHLILFC